MTATTQPASVAVDPQRNLRIDTPLSRTVRRFRRHRLAMVGLGFVVVLAMVAILAPLFTIHDPNRVNLAKQMQPPTAEHWLGTDPAGRDVYSRVIYATRISLSVGLVSVGLALSIALVLGMVAGFYGRGIDMVIMRITDVVMCIPSLILIMIVVSLIGPSIYNVMFALGILGWPGMTRLLRAQILSVRERDFITAARCLGVPNRRIMLVHVLPSSIAPVLVAATFSVAGAILTEAALSFLGFGVLPPTASWGNMLNAARSLSRLENNPWFWLPPGLMIMFTVLAINFIGDGLRDALDPKHRIR